MAVPTTPAVPANATAPVDGQRATYAASITGLASASSATDIFTITGSASMVVRVTRIRISAIKTSAGADVDIQLIKRSTADTGGTATNPTAIPYDSLDPAATATIAAYTANPTTGTAVGTFAVDSVWVGLATAQTGLMSHDFGNRPAHAVTLRSASEVLAVNLNGVTVGGGAFDIWVEWTESAA